MNLGERMLTGIIAITASIAIADFLEIVTSGIAETSGGTMLGRLYILIVIVVLSYIIGTVLNYLFNEEDN